MKKIIVSTLCLFICAAVFAAGNIYVSGNSGRVNAVEMFGLRGDGVTDNTSAISNAFNSGLAIYLPPARVSYRMNGRVIVTNVADVKADGPRSRISSFAGSNVFALTFTRGNSRLTDLVLDCNSANLVGGSRWASLPASGGGISFNAQGLSRMDRCEIYNASGMALYVAGDGNIFQRSNSCVLSDITVSNSYHSIWLAQSNLSEFVELNNPNVRRGEGYGIYIGGANVTVNGGQINGYVDTAPGGGDGVATGIGIFVEPSQVSAFPFRSHLRIMGVKVAHWWTGHLITGAGPVDIIGGISGGVGYNIYSNATQIKLVGFTSEVWAEHKLGNVNLMTAVGCSFLNGSMVAWWPWSYVGEANNYNGAPLPTGGNSDIYLKENISFLNAKLGTPGNVVTPVNYLAITNNGSRYFMPLFQ